METYNELLKEFHQQISPKSFTLQYKSLLDDLVRAKTRKRSDIQLKNSQLLHLKTEQTNILNCSSSSMQSLTENPRITSSRLEVRSIDLSHLKKEQEDLQHEIKTLKAKTIQITNELSLYNNRQTEFHQTNLHNSFSVFNHYQQLNIQVNHFSNEQMKEEEILHQLKARKERLHDEVQELVKTKAATDGLKRRLCKAKQGRVKTIKHSSLQTSQFREILRIFDILLELEAKYEQNKAVSVEEMQERYDCKDNVKASKTQLVRQYLSQGQLYDEKAASKITYLFKTLEIELDRSQRAHQQASQTLKTLEKASQKLTINLKRIHERTQRHSISALRQYYIDMNLLQKNFSSSCNRLNHFTTELYELARKNNAFFKTLEHVLEESEAGRKIMKVFPDYQVLKRYEDLLFRNPEEVWFQCHNFEKFKKEIELNSLLRMYFSPDNFNNDLEELDNYQKLITISFKRVTDFIFQLFKLIAQYFKITKSSKKVQPSSFNGENFCIESKDYYRRDNFKLLQKLESEELKRKGLLMKIPINIIADTEINQHQTGIKTYSSTSSLTPRCSILSRTVMKYTDLATKREEHSLRKQKIRKLFGKLDSVSRNENTFTTSHRNLHSSRLNNNFSSNNSFLPDRLLRRSRNTVGTLLKQNMRTQLL